MIITKKVTTRKLMVVVPQELRRRQVVKELSNCMKILLG
jgi:hypothetical protein